MSINAVVGNFGLASASNVAVQVYAWNSLGQLELLASERIASLLAGESTLITATWDSTGKTGENRVVIVVDAEGGVQESAESNNLAIKDVFVSDQAGMSITASVEAAQYSSNQPVNITVTMHNSGPAWNGILNVQIEDENGYPVAAFDPATISLGYARSQEKQFTWNTGAIFAGAYRVRARLQDGANASVESMITFTILPDMLIDASITTDRLDYGPRESMAIKAAIANNGNNYIVPALTARFKIMDSAGTVLFSQDKGLSLLLPGAEVEQNAGWTTGLADPGDYQAVLELLVDDRNILTNPASFTVRSSVVLTGGLSVPAAVGSGSTVKVVSTVINSGNTAALAVTARITIIDPESLAIKETREENIDLAADGSWSRDFGFSSEQYELKTYTAVLEAVHAGAAETISNASFAVKDLTPPSLSILSPAQEGIYNSTVSVSAAAGDNASGVDRVEYRIDEGPWNLLPLADPSQGRYASSWEPGTAAGGPHTVTFRASDRAGNASGLVSIGFVVQMDAEPPVTSITTGTPQYQAGNTVFVTHGTLFTLIATDNFSGVAGTEYRVDDGEWRAYTPFTLSGEGLHKIDYFSKDTAGNVEAFKTVWVTADNTRPVSSLTTGSPHYQTDGKLYISSSTGISIGATDAASGIAKIEYSIDEGDRSAYTEVFSLASSADGSHTIRYRSVDNVGSLEDEKELIVILDNTPPSTTVSTSDPLIEGAINTVSPSTFFTLTAGDVLSGVRSITYKVNNGEWQSYTGSFNLAGMEAGEYIIAFKATDNVQNEETEKAVTIRLMVLELIKKTSADPVVLIGAWRHDHKDHDDREKTKDRKEDDDHEKCSAKDEEHKHGAGALDKLTAMLSNAGISHYVPKDEDDFISSFRAGRFNTYILLDKDEDRIKEMEEEIREAVHYGQGLIYLKTRPDAEPKLDNLFGVSFSGRTTNENITINLLDSPISNEGTLETAGKAVLTVIAGTTAQSYAALNDKHKSYPAIVFNEYGRGKAILYAFDLLASPDQAKRAALLINSINHVRPAEQQPLALESIPVRIKLDNLPEPADVRVKEYLPDSTTADSVAPASQVTDNTITWTKSLEAGEKGLFGYYLNLPDLAGSYRTRTEVFYSNLGEFRLYDSYAHTLTVPADSAGLLTSVMTELGTLLPEEKDPAGRDRHGEGKDHSGGDEDYEHISFALRELSGIDAAASDRKAAGKNIERITKAIGKIKQVTFDVTQVRLKLDELLRVWEKKWYLMEQAEEHDEKHEQ